MIRRLIVALGVPLIVVLSPVAAWAQAGDASRDQVVLTGDVVVPRGTIVDEVVVFSGSVTIAGVARGDVVVLDGPVTISGQVGGDVVGLHGTIRLSPSAQVGGNVLAGGAVAAADGATVAGTIRHDVHFTMAGPTAALGALVASGAVAISLLLIMLLGLLLAPRGLERVAEAGHESPGACAGWGVLLVMIVPIGAVAAAATVLGLPLGLAVVLALGLLWLLGLLATSFVIGRLMVRPPRARVGALFVGWGLTAAVGLVPVVNVVWWTLGSAYGIGALVVATWRVRHATLVPGGRPGRHRALTAAPTGPPAAEPEAGRPAEMPLAED